MENVGERRAAAGAASGGMNIAVVGAGWAGLAAAVQAADLGHDVTVFEASHHLGGRGRGVDSRRLGRRIDNGQHILLGAYTATLALMQRLGADPQDRLLRMPLTVESADGGFRLQLGRAGPPLHLVTGLLAARGMPALHRWRLARALQHLKARNWTTAPGATVGHWLAQHRQPDALVRRFWRPLCVAALNTPIETACAQLFANVLRDSLDSHPHASDFLIPRTDLSALWPDAVARRPLRPGQRPVSLRTGSVVTALGLDPAPQHPDPAHAATRRPGRIRIHGEPFDAAILACNVPSTLRLLHSLPDAARADAAARQTLQALAAFDYVPIATVSLALARGWPLERPMYLLDEDRGAGRYGQWLFDETVIRTASGGAPLSPSLLHVVISDAADAASLGQGALVTAIQRQLAHEGRRFGAMPPVTHHDVIVEKRATFAAVPGLQRPVARTPWPGLWFAGDWTDTGYPAVLEGAVRSGQAAAQGVHDALAG